MDNTIFKIIIGICWTLVYIILIYRGFKDKSCGMPFFALAFNVSWEFVYAFLLPDKEVLQVVVNIIWFALDVLILFIYFRYGRKEFRYEKTLDKKWFILWSGLVIIISFSINYVAGLELHNNSLGEIYSAFLSNMMMSVLFIYMLMHRNDVKGQSMYIALFKWIGTACATAQTYLDRGDNFILVLGICSFIFDVIYIVMLHYKFKDLKIRPFLRI